MKTINIRRFATILFLSLMTIPVCAQSNLDLPQMKHEYDPLVFEHFEQMVSFPGGDRELINFIAGNLRCPKELKKARLRARVEVSFIIAKNGTVENVRAGRTILKNKRGVANFGNSELIQRCEEEAVRVFRIMPRWIPAYNFGARPKVKFRCNIFFNEPQEYDLEWVNEIWDEKDLDNYIHALPPTYSWTSTKESAAVTDLMKMKYSKPESFCQIDSAESFKDYKPLKYMILSGKESFFESVGPFLRSDDGQVISFLQFAPLFSREYVERISKLTHCFNDYNETNLYTLSELFEKYHQQKMQEMIGSYYYRDKNIEKLWHNHITVLSTEEAREKWNADSAFTFSLHLRSGDYYKKDYKFLKVLLIQRKGRGYACIYSFYTDKAKENFDKYWRRIEKTLWFEK